MRPIIMPMWLAVALAVICGVAALWWLASQLWADRKMLAVLGAASLGFLAFEFAFFAAHTTNKCFYSCQTQIRD